MAYKVQRQHELFDDFEQFCVKNRMGPSLIGKLTRPELQFVCQFLWDRSDLAQCKRLYKPRAESESDTDADIEPELDDPPARPAVFTRYAVDSPLSLVLVVLSNVHVLISRSQRLSRPPEELKKASASILTEELAVISHMLEAATTKLETVIATARDDACFAPARMLVLTSAFDFTRRYAKIIAGESKVIQSTFSPETMHFLCGAFQKVGRSSWMLLRSIVPLPHESYMRESTRGVCKLEGVRHEEIYRNMQLAIEFRRSLREREVNSARPIFPDSAFDIVLSFDEMFVRPQLTWESGSAEMRGCTTENTIRSGFRIMERGEVSQRIAKQYLAFVATPLNGGHRRHFTAASFAVNNITASELLKYLNSTITALTVQGFRVRILCCDGASTARKLQQRILTHSELEVLGTGTGGVKVAFQDPIYR